MAWPRDALLVLGPAVSTNEAIDLVPVTMVIHLRNSDSLAGPKAPTPSQQGGYMGPTDGLP